MIHAIVSTNARPADRLTNQNLVSYIQMTTININEAKPICLAMPSGSRQEKQSSSATGINLAEIRPLPARSTQKKRKLGQLTGKIHLPCCEIFTDHPIP